MAGEANSSANVKAFSTGDVIVRQGTGSPKEMIVVLQGNIGVYKDYGLNSEALVRVIGKGSFHGELSLFLNHEQEETLVALSKVMVMMISRRNVKEFFTDLPDMALSIVEGICGKLDEAFVTLSGLRGSTVRATSKKSALFPEGHGMYTLTLTNGSKDYLYSAKIKCPLCGHEFESMGVITSKLRLENVNKGLRPKYKDIEPAYYEIVTCPNCFFSAAEDPFTEASPRYASDVNQNVGPYKLEMSIQTGLLRDTFTVFAGYYLALLCAPVVSETPRLVTANLWLKISWLYQDCGEETLRLYACEKALADYHYAYENINIPEKTAQRICYLIGDLHFQLGDLDEARNFFFLAKTNKAGSRVMNNQADTRLEEIREIKKSFATAN